MRDRYQDLKRPWSEFEWEEVLREREASASEVEADNEEFEESEETAADREFDDHLEACRIEEIAALIEEIIKDDSNKKPEESLAEEFIFSGVGSSSEIAEGFECRSHPHFSMAEQLVIKLFDALEMISDNALVETGSPLLCAATGAAAHMASAIASSGSGEPGLTLAYLKRSIADVHKALALLPMLESEPSFGLRRAARFRCMFFALRDGLVDMLGEARREWQHISRVSE